MAVSIANGTLTVSTVKTETLTGWAPFIAVTVDPSVAGTAYLTAGVAPATPTVAGQDEYAVAAGKTIFIKNPVPRATLKSPDPTYTTLVGGTQTSTVVKLISSAALVYTVALVDQAPAVNVNLHV